MKNRFIMTIGAMIVVLAAMLTGATPAAAVQAKSCSVGGYVYNSSLAFHRHSGNVTFKWWTITAPAGGWPMEYRVRWYAPDHVTVLYDTNYVSYYNNSAAGGSPGLTRYFAGGTSYVEINAGKSGDGLPTCAMNYNIPG